MFASSFLFRTDQVKIRHHNYKYVTGNTEGNLRTTDGEFIIRERNEERKKGKKTSIYRLYSDFFGSISRPRDNGGTDKALFDRERDCLQRKGT